MTAVAREVSRQRAIGWGAGCGHRCWDRGAGHNPAPGIRWGVVTLTWMRRREYV